MADNPEDEIASLKETISEMKRKDRDLMRMIRELPRRFCHLYIAEDERQTYDDYIDSRLSQRAMAAIEGSEGPLEYSLLIKFLKETSGARNILRIAQRYTDDTQGLARQLRQVEITDRPNSLDRGLNQRIEGLMRGIEEQPPALNQVRPVADQAPQASDGEEDVAEEEGVQDQ